MSLEDAFKGMEHARATSPAKKKRVVSAPDKRKMIADAMKKRWAERGAVSGKVKVAAPARAAGRLPVPGMAKSKNPAFEAVKVYVRSETRKAAARKGEDEQVGDFSDLVEMLLARYLGE